jgi:hypothetical protein
MDMKFRLSHNTNAATIQRIGAALRRHGSGTHWIERYRGGVYLHVSEARDVQLLRSDFAEYLDEDS